MSGHERVTGTIRLPAAEVSRFRSVMNGAVGEQRDAVKGQISRWWDQVKELPSRARGEAVCNFAHQKMLNGRSSEAVLQAVELLSWYSQGRKPIEKDYAAMGLGAVTYRTSSWAVGEVAITLTGSEVTYSEQENDHAVVSARASRLGSAFFEYLDWVKWTPGTGGKLVADDDRSQDGQKVGGGGSSIFYRHGKSRGEEIFSQQFAARLGRTGRR